MSALEDQAAAVAGFYHQLIEAGVPEDAASVMAIDVNKVLSVSAKVPPPATDAIKADLAEAALAKREQRRRQLEGDTA
jgi:hypothetical protein